MNEYTIAAFMFGLVVGMVAGFFRGMNFWVKQMVEDPEGIARVLNNIKKDEANPTGKEEPMKIEKHGDMYYAFADNGDFLAQALTPTDLIDRIEKRFPDRVFKGALTKEQAKEMGIVQ
jgi:hypothetical protein